jgi:DNA-directed RNA polymerase specialized sigma24 family protein
MQDAVGGRAEFTAMFAQHVEAVWNHAYRLTGSWSKAEDHRQAHLRRPLKARGVTAGPVSHPVGCWILPSPGA